MSELHLVDHLITLVLLLVLPIEGWWEFRKLERGVDAGDPDARVEVYRTAVGRSWGFTLLVLVWWAARERGFEAIGLGAPEGTTDLAVLVGALLLVGLLYAQLRAVRGSAEAREQIRETVGGLAFLMPRTPAESRWWTAVSFTAGTTEEILYRGFLIFWVGSFTGPWVAALLAGTAFGIAHLYQGVAGIVKTGTIGIVMGLLFVGTGNLWAPMVLHIAIDAVNGEIAKVALTAEDFEAAASPSRLDDRVPTRPDS